MRKSRLVSRQTACSASRATGSSAVRWRNEVAVMASGKASKIWATAWASGHALNIIESYRQFAAQNVSICRVGVWRLPPRPFQWCSQRNLPVPVGGAHGTAPALA